MTGALWRAMAEVRALSWLMVAGYLVFALIFVAIYRKGYEKDKSGAGQGLRYGFWIGLLLGTTGSIGCYILMPVPLALAIGWFLGTMVECLITGWITGIVYKP